LILAGEQEARRRAVPILRLAVEVQNHGARRLYERLGYSLWEHGLVIDRWTQSDDQGTLSESMPTSALSYEASQ
jgi:hypothetical protein